MASCAEPSIPVSAPALEKGPAKAAHVNMMTDTIIANMPPEGLRTIMRGLLGVDPKVTTKLNILAVEYLAATRPATKPLLFENSEAAPALFDWQRSYRCTMGCEMGFESMGLLLEVIGQLQPLDLLGKKNISDSLMDVLATVDADIVQSVTAIEKELMTKTGTRQMSRAELDIFENTLAALVECKRQTEQTGAEFPFERGLSRIMRLQGRPNSVSLTQDTRGTVKPAEIPEIRTDSIERFLLGNSLVPRMFMGLWQFSSPAWGTASNLKINKDFRKHVDGGFTAYGALYEFQSFSSNQKL